MSILHVKRFTSNTFFKIVGRPENHHMQATARSSSVMLAGVHRSPSPDVKRSASASAPLAPMPFRPPQERHFASTSDQSTFAHGPTSRLETTSLHASPAFFLESSLLSLSVSVCNRNRAERRRQRLGGHLSCNQNLVLAVSGLRVRNSSEARRAVGAKSGALCRSALRTCTEEAPRAHMDEAA